MAPYFIYLLNIGICWCATGSARPDASPTRNAAAADIHADTCHAPLSPWVRVRVTLTPNPLSYTSQLGLLAQSTQVAIQPQPNAQTACCVYDAHSNCTHNGQITFIGTTITSWNGYLTCLAYGTLSQGFMLRLNVPNTGQVASCEFVRPAHPANLASGIPGIPPRHTCRSHGSSVAHNGQQLRKCIIFFAVAPFPLDVYMRLYMTEN